MQKILSLVFVIILILHGLIHLMGTLTYIQLGTIEELAYKTTLLDGRWDVGQTGIALFGALWAVTAIGFVFGAVSFLAQHPRSKCLLTAIALISLALTILDWEVAYAGVIMNVAILGLIWFGPHIGARVLLLKLKRRSKNE
jgi:hypothetical protein